MVDLIPLRWAQFTGTFVGRERESALLSELLSVSRLATIHGPAGVGKSRLAVEFSRRHIVGGGTVWYLDVDSVEGSGLLTASLAAALGLSSYPGDALNALCAFLSERRGIVVMDNCERAINECADLVATLLSHTPHCLVLTTSRTVLGLEIEHVLTLSPLETGTSSPGIGPAEQLFLDRASALSPDTEAPGRLNEVREICDRVGGNPLGIELAASRLRALSLDELAQSLARPFAILRRGPRMRSGRHSGLLESIQWSYGLCLPEEQRAWRAFSVFQGSFDADAAHALLLELPRADVVDLLQSLVEQAILSAVTLDGRRRFQMPLLIREFGREELNSEKEDGPIHERFLEWYASQGRQLDAAWLGPHQRDLLARAIEDLPNIRAAVELALGKPGSDERLLDLMIKPNPFLWWATGRLEEGVHWFERIAAYGSDSSALAYRCHGSAATYLAAIGSFDQAEKIADKLSVSAVAASDPRERVSSYFVSGFVSVMRREWEQAEAQISHGLQLLEGWDSLDPLWFQLKQIQMYMLLASQRYDAAAESCREVLEESERCGEGYYRSYALHGLAFRAWESGRSDLAGELLHEALQLVTAFPNRPENPPMLFLAGLLDLDAGNERRGGVLIAAAHGTARTLVSVWHPLNSPRATRDQLRSRLEALRTKHAPEWRHGETLSPEAALNFALDRSENQLTADLESLLTDRELQIAHLVAEHRSNREIAELLVISVRTAEGHVEQIRRKLGVHSRKEIRDLMLSKAAETA